MIRWKIYAYQSADPFNKKPFGIYWKFPYQLWIGHFIFLGNSNGIHISRIKPISKIFLGNFCHNDRCSSSCHGSSIVMLYVPCIAMRYVLCDIMENNCVYVCRTLQAHCIHNADGRIMHIFEATANMYMSVCVCLCQNAAVLVHQKHFSLNVALNFHMGFSLSVTSYGPFRSHLLAFILPSSISFLHTIFSLIDTKIRNSCIHTTYTVRIHWEQVTHSLIFVYFNKTTNCV